METGWMVTEIGRQPWIVYNVMRTSDAVTPMPEIVISLVVLTLVYIGLAFASGLILWRLARQTGLLAPDVVGLKGGENV
jgi:cytochrome bd ubiquinol oxidase subunit I